MLDGAQHITHSVAYVIFLGPAIIADAGMDKGAVVVATCLAAAIGSAS